MKKTFTFLFFAGMMTTAMAQNGGYAQHRNQNSDNRNQSTVSTGNNQRDLPSNGGYGQQVQGNNGYQQNSANQPYDQDYNRDNRNGYGFGGDRRYDERENNRSYHSNERYDHRYRGFERRRAYERYNRGRGNLSFSIRLGHPVRF